jgi:hypothetical protein
MVYQTLRLNKACHVTVYSDGPTDGPKIDFRKKFIQIRAEPDGAEGMTP